MTDDVEALEFIFYTLLKSGGSYTASVQSSPDGHKELVLHHITISSGDILLRMNLDKLNYEYAPDALKNVLREAENAELRSGMQDVPHMKAILQGYNPTDLKPMTLEDLKASVFGKRKE